MMHDPVRIVWQAKYFTLLWLVYFESGVFRCAVTVIQKRLLKGDNISLPIAIVHLNTILMFLTPPSNCIGQVKIFNAAYLFK